MVLAAGFSRRLGRPKQSVELGGETLLARAVRVAHASELTPVVIVTGAHVDQASLDLSVLAANDSLVLNRAAEEGIASSIRVGVDALRTTAVAGAVLMTCDQVALNAEHLRALTAEPQRLTGSRYAGRVGIPAYFPKSFFDRLLHLRGNAGARELLLSAHSIQAEELALDIDTEADVERAATFLGNQPSTSLLSTTRQADE